MSTTREQAMEALQTLLTGAYSWGAVTRRNQSPEQIASPSNPGLVLVKHSEQYERQSPSQPPRRTMVVIAAVYIDVGTNVNAIPDAVLNPIQDAIDTALAPDDPSSNRCTLGGRVFSVMIKGTIINAPGDKIGKGIALIPIEIILPSPY
jgi:hypothetical protein